MIDLKKILALPPAQRDLEIRKLIVPKPWKHKWYNKFGQFDPICQKCQCKWSNEDQGCRNSCIPDPIPLDWNLAMKMRDEAVKEFGPAPFLRAAEKVRDLHWQIEEFVVYSQSHHYILAALIAKGEE